MCIDDEDEDDEDEDEDLLSAETNAGRRQRDALLYCIFNGLVSKDNEN